MQVEGEFASQDPTQRSYVTNFNKILPNFLTKHRARDMSKRFVGIRIIGFP